MLFLKFQTKTELVVSVFSQEIEAKLIKESLIASL